MDLMAIAETLWIPAKFGAALLGFYTALKTIDQIIRFFAERRLSDEVVKLSDTGRVNLADIAELIGTGSLTHEDGR